MDLNICTLVISKYHIFSDLSFVSISYFHGHDTSPPPSERWRDSNEGGGRAKAEVTKRAMVTATMVVSNNMSDGNGNKGGRQAVALREMVAAMTVVGKDEGNGISRATKRVWVAWRWQR